MKKYFKNYLIIEKQLYNYFDRTLIQALAITFFEPPFNKQIYHKAVAFIKK